MATKTYFINSPEALYNDAEFAWFQSLMLTEGIIGDENGDIGFEVTENDPLADMSVLVSEGKALVELTKSGRTFKVVVESTAVEQVSVAANSTGNNRVDAVIIRVDKDATPNENKTNIATVEVITGSGTSPLTDGAIDTAVGNDGWLRLANITVPDGTTDIENGDIADVRSKVYFNDGLAFSPLFIYSHQKSVDRTEDYGKIVRLAEDGRLPKDFIGDGGVMTAEFDQSQTTSNQTQAVGEANSTGKKNKLAQSFVAGVQAIRGVRLWKIANTGTFTGTVTISLQADNAGSPSGSSLATYTISNATYNSIKSAAEFGIDFGTPYTGLVVGDLYWIVIETSTSDDSNRPNLGANSAGGYDAGTLKYNNSIDGWVTVSTSKLYFRTVEGILGGRIVQLSSDEGELPASAKPYAFIEADNTGGSVASSTTPTTFYSRNLPANLFKKNGGIKMIFRVAISATSTWAVSGTINIKFNGTTVLSIGMPSVQNTNNETTGYHYIYQVYIINQGATNSQKISGVRHGGISGVNSFNGMTAQSPGKLAQTVDFVTGTSSVETNQPVFLQIEGTLSTNHGNLSMNGLILERIG